MGIHEKKGKIQEIGTVTKNNGTRPFRIVRIDGEWMYIYFEKSYKHLNQDVMLAFKEQKIVQVRYVDDKEFIIEAAHSDGNKRKFKKIYALSIKNDPDETDPSVE